MSDGSINRLGHHHPTTRPHRPHPPPVRSEINTFPVVDLIDSGTRHCNEEHTRPINDRPPQGHGTGIGEGRGGRNPRPIRKYYITAYFAHYVHNLEKYLEPKGHKRFHKTFDD